HLPEMAGVDEVPEQTASHWLGAMPIGVLGGTSWGIRKDVAPGSIDLVVFDEGSQMKPAEACIPFRRLRPGGGLIVAGDDRQLPPIVQGRYPDPPPGEPILHRSLFECLRDPAGHARWTATLLENWRMNEWLCRYPAEQVYVAGYRSATESASRRRLELRPPATGSAIPDAVPDPVS